MDYLELLLNNNKEDFLEDKQQDLLNLLEAAEVDSLVNRK